MTLSRIVASGFGTGYVPVAAGTVASAVAALVGAGLLSISPVALWLAAAVAILGGYLAIERAGVNGDPGWVVVDEFAGQWVAMLAMPKATVAWVAAAFVLFRLFDITKLGPVSWADRQHGSFGIMADDVIAGIIAGLLMIVARGASPDW